ncbi:hypothetical protein [Robinsoniella peoriensis]|uniref:hypothetical protein n=1 Tax=Robinsoniella peoriensis TaxID=180332 RepID=UPI003633F562
MSITRKAAASTRIKQDHTPIKKPALEKSIAKTVTNPKALKNVIAFASRFLSVVKNRKINILFTIDKARLRA